MEELAKEGEKKTILSERQLLRVKERKSLLCMMKRRAKEMQEAYSNGSQANRRS
jgi:hypothetical protein